MGRRTCELGGCGKTVFGAKLQGELPKQGYSVKSIDISRTMFIDWSNPQVEKFIYKLNQANKLNNNK